jgi:hypothetical protein
VDERRFEGKTAPCEAVLAHVAELTRRQRRREAAELTAAQAARIDLEVDQELPSALVKCRDMPWPGPYRACALAAVWFQDLDECARLTWPTQYNQVLFGRCAEAARGRGRAAEQACIDRMLCGHGATTRAAVVACWE